MGRISPIGKASDNHYEIAAISSEHAKKSEQKKQSKVFAKSIKKQKTRFDDDIAKTLEFTSKKIHTLDLTNATNIFKPAQEYSVNSDPDEGAIFTTHSVDNNETADATKSERGHGHNHGRCGSCKKHEKRENVQVHQILENVLSLDHLPDHLADKIDDKSTITTFETEHTDEEGNVVTESGIEIEFSLGNHISFEIEVKLSRDSETGEITAKFHFDAEIKEKRGRGNADLKKLLDNIQEQLEKFGQDIEVNLTAMDNDGALSSGIMDLVNQFLASTENNSGENGGPSADLAMDTIGSLLDAVIEGEIFADMLDTMELFSAMFELALEIEGALRESIAILGILTEALLEIWKQGDLAVGYERFRVIELVRIIEAGDFSQNTDMQEFLKVEDRLNNAV